MEIEFKNNNNKSLYFDLIIYWAVSIIYLLLYRSFD